MPRKEVNNRYDNIMKTQTTITNVYSYNKYNKYNNVYSLYNYNKYKTYQCYIVPDLMHCHGNRLKMDLSIPPVYPPFCHPPFSFSQNIIKTQTTTTNLYV